MLNRITHALSKVVIADESTGLPTEVMFFSAGENITSKGSFIYNAKEAAALTLNQKNTDTRDRLPFDLAHLSTTGSPTLDAQKAYGWFTLDYADDGIWARDIKWTDTGAALIKNKEFRFLSPTFNTDKNGNITDIINIALTNWPATMGLQPLIEASKNNKDTMSTQIELETAPVAETEDPNAPKIEVELDEKDVQIQDLTTQLQEANMKCAEMQAKLAEYEAAQIDAEKQTLLSNSNLTDKEKTYWLKKNLGDIKEYLELKSDSTPITLTKTVDEEKVTKFLNKKAPVSIVTVDADKEAKHNKFLIQLKKEAEEAANRLKY